MLPLGLLLSSSLVFAETNPSLATVLTPEGGIAEGVSGSFDPAGFRMTYGSGGEPVFVPDDPSSVEPVPAFDEQYVEGYWDYRFDYQGVDGPVNAMAFGGTDAYLGGAFTQAGGVSANRVARWDGNSWSALGSGVNNEVHAITVISPDVYVGGKFSQAGGYYSFFIASWMGQGTAIDPTEYEETPGILAFPNPMTSGANLSFQSIGLSPLTLSVYDTAGRLVRTQELGTVPAGSHTHYWDGRDGSGSPLACGVYFVRLSSTELQASTRVVLIR
jgi:hypothetical protein